MIYFSIKDLESFSGIKAHTIRTWEQRFTFLQPKRSEGLRRTYDYEELKLLLNISFLNRNGYKVSYIAKLEKEEMSAVIAGLSDTNHKQEKAVNELMCCMADMDTEG
ncbi:MAG TPA: MerR family transcriptional regulator, partial [Flavisolibacter sp.]|nr:MerR family transcriptional regulator [Flavisolibacter sp.]